MNQNKTPHEAHTFTHGAATSPAVALQTWLDANKEKLLRFPIVLSQGAFGFGTANAKIGAGADAVTVFLDDSALGIGIADKAHKCKDSCALIVEGYWQGKGMAGDLEIKVVKADLVELATLGSVVEIEAPGPNSN